MKNKKQIVNKNYLLLIAFLVLIAVTSKELLIYNEETIIAVCFGLFVYVLNKNLKNMVANELQDRADKIRHDLEYFSNVRKETLNNLIEFHQLRQNLTTEIDNIAKFSETTLLSILKKRQLSLKHLINSQINTRLNLIKTNELQLAHDTKNIIVNVFENKLIAKSKAENAPWRDSLNLLKTLTTNNSEDINKKRNKKRS
uniref:ATP synthase F0 subunit b n=1 Tax=Palpitomonas bilix TaxID=652834 RepID=A0A1E1GHQ4_9EUKA|nr:ATP synthase F0 subunit b [Palpitomonas bilix]BAV82401.1 ATP synthase F0 subunit b [Palpitomonas bilix]